MTPSEHPLNRPEEGPDRTQKLTLPHEEVSPLQTVKISHSGGGPEGPRPPAAGPGRGRSGSWTLPLVFGVLTLAGAALYFVSVREPAPSREASAPASESVPPGAQVYLDQAKAGDAHAMRMLGVMYYYGLNVPQDREKGLQWYRKAAEQGSEAARAELARLEGTGS